MQTRAILKNTRISAHKARLVADLVRGRDVSEALEILQFTNKKSAPILKKLIESAVANAEQQADRDDTELDVDELFIHTIYVDQGPTLRRFRPRAHGRATRILKQSAHITVVLETR